MLLQYALESGYLDANPLENILHPERAALVSRQDRYVRGILNPRRLLKGDWGERKRKTNASELLSMAPGTAHQLGTGNFGFSINPGLTDVTERSAGITSNRAGIFPYMN